MSMPLDRYFWGGFCVVCALVCAWALAERGG